MRDFLGNQITVGSFLAKGGGGNGSGSYGMVLYRVLVINPTSQKLTVERITVRYNHTYSSDNRAIISTEIACAMTKSVISNQNSVVMVPPTERIQVLWDAVLAKQVSKTDAETISNWIHGAEHQRPWGD